MIVLTLTPKNENSLIPAKKKNKEGRFNTY